MPTGQRNTPARKTAAPKVATQEASATSNPEAEKTEEATGGQVPATPRAEDGSEGDRGPSAQELDEAQRQIAELKDQLAKAKGAKDPELEYGTVENPGDEKNILIHFVRDGFCELGTVWYRGQELELEPGTPAYAGAKGWANLSADQQEEIYGDVYFRKGEWKGKTYEEKAAADAERRRGRAVPRSTE